MITTRTVLGAITIPAETSAVASSRRWLGRLLNEEHADIRDDLVLLLSEVVTNAILYSDSSRSESGTVTIIARDIGDAVRVEVTDAGSATRAPQVLEHNLEMQNGRGLDILDMLSAGRWGTYTNHTRRTVWFEVVITERGAPEHIGGQP